MLRISQPPHTLLLQCYPSLLAQTGAAQHGCDSDIVTYTKKLPERPYDGGMPNMVEPVVVNLGVASWEAAVHALGSSWESSVGPHLVVFLGVVGYWHVFSEPLAVVMSGNVKLSAGCKAPAYDYC